jgi:hypothetical protein
MKFLKKSNNYFLVKNLKTNTLFVIEILFIILFTILPFHKSDLPVHCLSSNIEGDWLIHMGENRYDSDLKCGHKRPDQNLDHFDINVEKIFKQKYEIAIKLERPDKVLTIKENKQIGKWTMVYDEGFEFTINNQVFFAFSRYKKVGIFSPTNTDSMETKGYKNICDKTFIGWYHNHNNKNWGCYYAEKFDIKKSNLDFEKIDYKIIFSLREIPEKRVNDNVNVNENNNDNYKEKLNENENENNYNNNKSIDNRKIKISAIANLKRNYLEKERQKKIQMQMQKRKNLKNLNLNINKNTNNNNNNNNDNNNNNKNKDINNNRFKSKNTNEFGLENLETNNNNNNINNSDLNLSYSDISYSDFINSMGWTNSNSNSKLKSNLKSFSNSSKNPENEIPHLDIFFSDNNNNNNQRLNSEFLETESSTKLFEPDNNYVEKINNPDNKYTWTAKVYDEFKGKSYSSMRNLLGGINYLKAIKEKNQNLNIKSNNNNNKNNNNNIKSFLELSSVYSFSSKNKDKSFDDDEDINKDNKENEIEEIEINEREIKNNINEESKYGKIPKSFDWRNVDGTNYDSPIRKQGECGSCYAIAAVSVLESRIQIKSNNRLKPVLSPASVISCSRFNQGCFGGYPYLVGKFAKEFGFVEESCQPYTEKDDKCYDYCFHTRKYKAKDYG